MTPKPQNWKVGDFILALDGPLCAYTGRNAAGLLYGQVVNPLATNAKVGIKWSLEAGGPLNKRLSRSQVVNLLLWGKT